MSTRRNRADPAPRAGPGSARVRVHNRRTRVRATAIAAIGRTWPGNRRLPWPGREFGEQGRAFAGGAPHAQCAADALDTVFEARQARAAGRVGAAAPVVADSQLEDVAGRAGDDVDGGCTGVLGRVRQRLRYHVVGGDLDTLGQPPR